MLLKTKAYWIAPRIQSKETGQEQALAVTRCSVTLADAPTGLVCDKHKTNRKLIGSKLASKIRHHGNCTSRLTRRLLQRHVFDTRLAMHARQWSSAICSTAVCHLGLRRTSCHMYTIAVRCLSARACHRNSLDRGTLFKFTIRQQR